MKCYVAGFYFDTAKKSVALVHKNRPDWQAGQVNAIGGKIEVGEHPTDAMTREFLEETGVTVTDWEHVVVIYGSDWKVYFLKAFGNPAECKTMEDEDITTYLIEDALKLPNLISNLRWILALALDNMVKLPLRIPYITEVLD